MRRGILAAALAASLGVAAAAEALTIRDVIELSRAGLGEEVLLALIEVDRGVYAIDPETLKALKDAGVSEKVIVALVRSGREQPPAPEPLPVEPPMEQAQAQPPVVVVEHHDTVQPVAVPVPVYVAVAPIAPGRHRSPDSRTTTASTFVPLQFGPGAVRPVQPEPKRPVYWGYGGKLRPDAWKPHGHRPDGDEPGK